ncbi:MAG: MFS transporter, partial [Paralcaligenes sp.]
TLFKGRNFTSGTVTISVAYGVFFGTVVLLPLWMQSTLGYTATDAGIASAPVGILAIIFSPIVGKMLAKRDPRYIVTTSFLIFALISYMRSEFNTEVDIVTIMIPTFIQGAAMAMFFIPLTTITLSGLEPHRIPAAAGLTNFVRLLFGAFGTSITTTLWENRAVLHHAQLAEIARPGKPAFDAAMAGLHSKGMTQAQSATVINNLINQQAFTMSAADIFYASAILFLVLIGLVWFARPKKAGAGASVAAGAH